MEVEENFQQRPERVFAVGGAGGRLLPLLQEAEGLGELAEGLVGLLLPGPAGPRLQVDLVAQGHELGQECVQVHGARAGRRQAAALAVVRRQRRRLVQPGAEVGQHRLDGLGRQPLWCGASSSFRGTRRRVVRHASSSMIASTVSFLPASNSR